MSKPSRSERRSKFDTETRVSLLEDDHDQHEVEHQEFEAVVRDIKDGQARLTSVIVGGLTTLLVAVILLAINLALGLIQGGVG